MNAADVMKLIEEKGIKFVDYRFTDTRGKEQHVTVPISAVDEDVFEDGKMFDGSSIAGWKGIQESDMILMPDPVTASVDPFFEEPTLVLTCDVIEPNTMQGYERDPRSLARRAEAYLKSTGIGDTAFFGPENEFFVFWSGKRIFRFRRRALGCRHQWLLLQDRFLRGRLEFRARLRGWQLRPPSWCQGWLLPGTTGGFDAGSPLRYVLESGSDGAGARSASPRSRHGWPSRNRRPVQHPGA